ncbi:MAG: 30S ribosomal protein S5 [Patescibacteria group bacterium]
MRPQERKSFSKRPKSEFDDRLLEIRRVTRVMAGGKRFSFRATVVVGDRNGRIGVGVAKGLDVMAAVTKGRRQAEKKLIMIPRKENRTIPYEVEAKYGAARIRVKPASKNHGLIAGGPARVIFELAGMKDITAKVLGRTKNRLSNAMAALEALKMIKIPHGKKEEPKPIVVPEIKE